MINTRPTMTDQTQRDSSTSREFQQRFKEATDNEWVSKTLYLKQLVKAGKLPKNTEINNKNADLARATEGYATHDNKDADLARSIKADKSSKVPTVKGVSNAETELMERIARATEQADNDTSYRTAQKVNEHLTHKNKQLKEDKRRQKQYEAVLQASMQPDPYYS